MKQTKEGSGFESRCRLAAKEEAITLGKGSARSLGGNTDQEAQGCSEKIHYRTEPRHQTLSRDIKELVEKQPPNQKNNITYCCKQELHVYPVGFFFFFLLIADLLSSRVDNGVNLEASKHFPGDARSNFIRAQTIWDLFRLRGWFSVGPHRQRHPPCCLPRLRKKKKNPE